MWVTIKDGRNVEYWERMPVGKNLCGLRVTSVVLECEDFADVERLLDYLQQVIAPRVVGTKHGDPEAGTPPPRWEEGRATVTEESAARQSAARQGVL